jgi:hypothetical protein
MLGIITAGLMFTAVVMLSVYCTHTATSLRPKPSYEVYDDITLSQAHMLMPAKQAVNISDPAAVSSLLAAATAAGGGDVAAVLRSGRMPVRPGDAGRWLLPDADGDWDDWASLMAAVHSMVDLWAAYTLFQGIILVLLVFRWAGPQVYSVVCTSNAVPVGCHAPSGTAYRWHGTDAKAESCGIMHDWCMCLFAHGALVLASPGLVLAQQPLECC